MKIAVITPQHKEDYLVNTIIDGLIGLNQTDNLVWRCPDTYKTYLSLDGNKLSRKEFIDFAKKTDLIIFCWGKDNTDLELAETVGCWQRTVYVDGSEPGGNNRYDPLVQRKILSGDMSVRGAVDRTLLEKCLLYFRREKPYVDGIIPLPFGIERRYLKYFNPTQPKDIDFFCVFGQTEFPPLRRDVQGALIEFCRQNNFTCVTKTTAGFSVGGDKTAGRAEFYKQLSRSKVGISVGGGGFDTARFWEILANNCILLTEKIDIYQPGSKKLNYERIWKFNDLADFKYQLARISKFLREGYNEKNLAEEYKKIISEHSSKARILEIIETFNHSKNGK